MSSRPFPEAEDLFLLFLSGKARLYRQEAGQPPPEGPGWGVGGGPLGSWLEGAHQQEAAADFQPKGTAASEVLRPFWCLTCPVCDLITQH